MSTKTKHINLHKRKKCREQYRHSSSLLIRLYLSNDGILEDEEKHSNKKNKKILKYKNRVRNRISVLSSHNINNNNYYY